MSVVFCQFAGRAIQPAQADAAGAGSAVLAPATPPNPLADLAVSSPCRDGEPAPMPASATTGMASTTGHAVEGSPVGGVSGVALAASVGFRRADHAANGASEAPSERNQPRTVNPRLAQVPWRITDERSVTPMSTNDEFRREDPPDSAATTPLSVKYANELAKVKAEPGEWFRLCSYSGASPQGANRSAVALRKQTSGYEFRASKGVVYARFVGTEAV